MALVARENQLAAYLLAAMFTANARLPPVTLSQKWVSGHINIHCSEKDEKYLNTSSQRSLNAPSSP